jgi:hypothetical protein
VLNSHRTLASKANKDKIDRIISLYQDGKIFRYQTALDAILLLASQNKNIIKSGKPDRVYNDIVKNMKMNFHYEKNLNITLSIMSELGQNPRIAEARRKRKIKEEEKVKKSKRVKQHFSLKVILYRSEETEEDIKNDKTRSEQEKAELIKNLNEENNMEKKKSGRYFKGYRQIYFGDVNVWTWSDDNRIQFF